MQVCLELHVIVTLTGGLTEEAEILDIFALFIAWSNAVSDSFELLKSTKMLLCDI